MMKVEILYSMGTRLPHILDHSEATMLHDDYYASTRVK